MADPAEHVSRAEASIEKASTVTSIDARSGLYLQAIAHGVLALVLTLSAPPAEKNTPSSPRTVAEKPSARTSRPRKDS